MALKCPDCGGDWNLDEEPVACPSCRLSVWDMEAAAAWLAERDLHVPSPKCPRCGLLAQNLRHVGGRQVGWCERHGDVLVVDRFVLPSQPG